MSQTFQPKKKKRKRVHGFLKRQRSRAGRRLINRRRYKKRKRLTP